MLNRLSQFAGAYANATIDKAVEVESLILEKAHKIAQLEQAFSDEKKRIDLELQARINDLQ